MTAPPAQFDIYEVHTLRTHIVTSEEAATNAITIPDIEAHEVVIANAKFARAYGELSATEREGTITHILALAPRDATQTDIMHAISKRLHPQSKITNVSYNAPDTTVAFDHLSEGEQIDMFIPIASPPPLSDVQFGISHDLNFYNCEGNYIDGTGKVFIQSPNRNDDLKNCLATILSKDNDVPWNKTWLLDVICADHPIHDVFFEVQLRSYGQTRQGQTTAEFAFVLPQHIY